MARNHPGADLKEVLPRGEQPVNISRRRFLLKSAGATAGALVLGFGLPIGQARAQLGVKTMVPGTRVPAFLEIGADNLVRLQSPFMEGGQGIFTAMAQIVGEELDADPSTFVVSAAPTGADFQVMGNGMRLTGGSMSVRTSYDTMRKLGALARRMLMQAAADQWSVPLSSLTTEPGKVLHAASGRALAYGQLAPRALDLPVPAVESVTLRDPATFRWIGKGVARLDMHEKSVGKAVYSIDVKVEGMLHAAVQHAPRLGMEVAGITNEDQLKAMHGVHSVHRLPGAVAVVAERWWNAKRAAEAAQVQWKEPGPDSKLRYMPADFSSDAFSAQLAEQAAQGGGDEVEAEGDLDAAFKGAHSTLEATYRSQYVNHGQLEPPSATARFSPDGSLELWLPNQAPDMFLADVAKRTGLGPAQITLHSPLLGGFFGRHFLYDTACPYPQAIELARTVGRPVKLIWSREEEFLRDALRPMAAVRFRGALDAQGMPVALEAVSATEGPTEGIAGQKGETVDPTSVEGLSGKSYAIANRRVARLYVKNPVVLGYWRSVGNSMNDFFYESFLDELADKGKQDPYELRLKLLRDNPRLTTLLKSVVELSGAWKRGPFTAEDGSQRARGIAMASPFGTQTAAIAEVSIEGGQVRVHELWQAIDPGSIVNPAIIDAQVNSAVALGVSQVLLEESVWKDGTPVARNYDMYPILAPSAMPRVHVRIVESGEKMGGIGEPGLPAVPAAVANAVSALTHQRVRSMPMSRLDFGGQV
ncbi:molybdopterin cofactor-binding domain-containing protein [Xanthomonas campestris pv. plantaginis]|uniref:xanthine dehydrogenase family protein molybdopterin-binding subunit n=1 Tax=Xanthomonas campestris TaxID=339 RepID=UPI002B224953|nr:molybdopterin cofactor-binding domain-containing protein [Xanthomonas campestris]MEA9608866.1 molybdopterin cofactor-binding domain-containing protein [Xanthomonas campestris pv. plantaginis]